MTRHKFWDNIANYLERSSSARKFHLYGHLLRIVCAPFGWTFLALKYRDKNKMATARRELYEDSYGLAGITILTKLLLITAGLAIVLLVYAIVTGRISS